VYGKRYAREIFGAESKVAHLGDIPGYTRQYPQILSKSDTRNMVMTRMAPVDQSLFRWKAPDGSEGTAGGSRWDSIALWMTAAREIRGVQDTTPAPIHLGWGTDLWAPNDRLVENVPLLNRRLTPTQFRLATPGEYFRAAENTPDIPVLSGEIPSSWANVISSMSRLWPPIITATDTLLTAEKFAAIDYALGYADYPAEELDSLWKKAAESLSLNPNNLQLLFPAGRSIRILFGASRRISAFSLVRMR
jgi:hypothetical protein